MQNTERKKSDAVLGVKKRNCEAFSLHCLVILEQATFVQMIKWQLINTNMPYAILIEYQYHFTD